MLIEQQIGERQARAGAAVARALQPPGGGACGDYRIKSGSGKIYRVAVRGRGLFENYCSCPDFAVDRLGTCNHYLDHVVAAAAAPPEGDRDYSV
jgi:predicted nucleic acid-binding Zn finger protein